MSSRRGFEILSDDVSTRRETAGIPWEIRLLWTQPPWHDLLIG